MLVIEGLRQCGGSARLRFIALIVGLVFVSSRVNYAQQIEARRVASLHILDDCGADQFFDYSRSKCQNCSDIMQLFQTNQDWIHREVISGGNVAGGSSLGQNRQQQRNKPSGLTVAPGFTRRQMSEKLQALNAKDISASADIADGDSLSRLITVDVQDPEFVELISEDQEVDDAEQSRRRSGSSSSLDFDQSVDGDLFHSTKQLQLTVDRFLMSSLIEEEIPNVIQQCRQNQNSTACQMWANMCVMTMYAYSDSLSLHSTSASSTKQQSNSRTGKGRRTSGRRWQDCKQFNMYSICNGLRDFYRTERKSNTEILAIYAIDELFSKPSSSQAYRSNQPIQLLAYKYSYDGQLLKIDQFGLGEMEKFCHTLRSTRLSSPDTDASLLRVGKNLQLKCQSDNYQASLTAAKYFNETVFVDLYIGYPVNGAMFVKPIPVLVKNFIHNGVQVNRKYARDSSRWKLVHRFFYQSALNFANDDDLQSSLTSSQTDSDPILIYVKSATLDFRYKLEEKGTHMSSVLLTLDYGQLQQSHQTRTATASNNSTIKRRSLILNVESDISVSHSLVDMHGYKKDLDLVMTIMCILSTIWSLIKCYNIQKCHGVVKLDLESLVKFLIVACDVVANLLAVTTFAFISYLFFMFRFQAGLQILAPNEDIESALSLNFRLALIFKLIGFAQKIYTNLTVDLFFVDWEKPKMLTSAQILNHLSHNQKSSANQQNTSSAVDAIAETKTMGIPSQQPSFWRPYTVINRWIKLQTLRRQNIALQLLILVSIFEISQIATLATVDPNSNVLAAPETGMQPEVPHLKPTTSAAFRAYIIALVYIAISLAQYIFKKYLYEIFIRHEINQFIDLCSVANVGLFCMLYPRFGYYIHGRNANGSGDCSLVEMNALLEREERDLCSKRGLAPNSDDQLFIVILPRVINDHYRKLLLRDDLHSFTSNKDKNPTSLGRFNQDSGGQTVSRNLLWSTMNLSLSSTLTSSAQSKSSSLVLNRNSIGMMASKNKAINTFLINFLEHNYRDIDYSIRDRRRFQDMLLLDVDFDEENLLNRNLGPVGMTASGHDKPPAMSPSTAATFFRDNSYHFTSFLLLGLELDLILVELLSLIILDAWFGQSLIMAVQIVWLLNYLFKSLYLSCARQNLVSKALVDEKFLTV